MLSEPRVVEGLRGTADRGQLSDQPQLPQNVPPPRNEGERVFISSNASLRMTLWVDWEKVTYTSTGRRQPDRRDIQFRGGVYRTSDPREIEAIEKATTFGTEVLDLQKIKQVADKARLDAALTAADDPAIAEALRVKLGAKDHTMPPKPGAEKTAGK